MTKSADKTANKPFERSLDELQRLLERMESGDLNLEESMQAFERGVQITRQAQKSLAEAEQRIQLLTGSSDGPVVGPFHKEES